MICGAGGLGREVAWLVGEINAARRRWDLLGFLDDDPRRHGSSAGGVPVLGDLGSPLPAGTHAVLAIGDPRARRRAIERLEARAVALATLVHPGVALSPSVSVGEGSVVMPGVVLTVDIWVGRHVLLSPGCTVGHDTVIGDGSSLMPGVHLAGAVTLGERVFVGMGASVISGITIGSDVVLGAGAVVIDHLPPGVTAVGVPARVIREGCKP